MKYAGRVYDGPWEGRQLANDRPWCEFNWSDYGSVSDFRPWLPMESIPMTVTYQRFEYRWSAPLRAWVFVWPSRRR